MDKKIKKLILQVLKPLNYQEVYLFGSRARGDFAAVSDYDLLVILEDPIPLAEKMSLSAKIRRQLAQLGIDADILIKSRAEVEVSKDRIGNVVREALREGVAL